MADEPTMQEANEQAMVGAEFRATTRGAQVAAEYDAEMERIDAQYERDQDAAACNEAVERAQAVYDAALAEFKAQMETTMETTRESLIRELETARASLTATQNVEVSHIVGRDAFTWDIAAGLAYAREMLDGNSTLRADAD